MDLTSINRSIDSKQTELDNLHRKAQAEHQQASSRVGIGNEGEVESHSREALRYDQQAQSLSNEINQLNQQRQDIENQVHDLEQQRSSATEAFEAQTKQLDDQITRLRGSGM